jgi:hypothetical protein
MSKAPIVLFTYARPEHTRHTVEALLKNDGVQNHDLIIFSDGAKSAETQMAVTEVRAYLSTISGFSSIKIHHRTLNLGLAQSVIQGVGQVLSEYEQVIVLEDDLVTSPYFLAYMNEALRRFEHDDRVVSIHGYSYPVKQKLPDAFFLRGADCWGWATWRRGWQLFNSDGQALLDELVDRKLIDGFDFNSTFSYSKMLKNQIRGLNDSWAVRWYASAFLANKLTLYPGRSLVHNIGNDGSGRHSGVDARFVTGLATSAIDLTAVDVAHSALGQAAFEAFFREAHDSFYRRARRGVKKLFDSIAS